MEADLKELQLQVFSEISRVLGQAQNPDQALESILGALSRSLALKQAGVSLHDRVTGQWRGLTFRDPASEGPATAGRRPWEELAGLILETAQPFVIPAGGQEPIFLSPTRALQLHKERLSFLGVPMMLQGAPIGVLMVDRLFGADIPLEEDLRFLGIIAALMAPWAALEMQGGMPAGNQRPETLPLHPAGSDNSGKFFIVGQSPAIQKVLQLIKKLAPGRAPVLLSGESGAGKNLTARVLHEMSPRARYPFLKINCASRPENLLAAELFGYEKDAVPGTAKARAGRLEEADGGSIFLEEIGEMSLGLQARMARFLQVMEFKRLGGHRIRKVEVRLIAATTRDLAAAVKSGAFREDLYYLLSQSPVRLPPLRERRPDIPLLLNHFLEKVSKEYDRRFYLTQRALEVLQDYAWPGNVREMENLVERLCLGVDGAEISVRDLPPYLHPAAQTGAPEDQAFMVRLKDLEKREILAALERNRWIQSQAAMDLGLTLRQIGYRVKQFGLEKLIKEQRGHGRQG
jgi:Nif-specific regulatory protein